MFLLSNRYLKQEFRHFHDVGIPYPYFSIYMLFLTFAKIGNISQPTKYFTFLGFYNPFLSHFNYPGIRFHPLFSLTYINK